MKAILFSFFALASCAAATATTPDHGPLQQWQALQEEVVSTIAGGAACGPASSQVGFCRHDDREVPTRQEAALSEACRGQPAAYLTSLGSSPSDLSDRRAMAGALRQLFASGAFAAPQGDIANPRILLKTFHDRDQALRFFRPDIQASNPSIIENSKWVAICAHALLARRVVNDFLARTTVEALAADEELANYAWLLVQHSDFDPQYQLRMSQWFGRSQAPHMARHSAYLHDRGTVGLGRLQRFGTQIRCQNGAWAPFPVEDTQNLDARRARLGLAPMAQHLAGRRPCPPAR